MTTRSTYKRLDVMTPDPTATGAKLIQDNTKLTDDVLAAIPDGGTAGQVLKKTSGTDYDTEWADQTATITVDSALSTSSTNPVQNAVITNALNGKIDNGELATVATTGAYSDLTGTPTIPDAYTLPTASLSTLGGVKVGTNLAIANGVLSASTGTTANTVSAGNHTHAYSAITDKPTLATVATTGSFNDLTNQPTVDSALSTTSQNAIQNAIATQAINGKADTNHTHVTGDITNFPELATVASTGAYSDLTGTPAEYVLPAATSTTLGGVIPDGTTITVDSVGNITAVQGGGSSIADPLNSNSLLRSSNYEWVEESPMDVSTTANVNAVLARNSDYDGFSWVNVSAFGGSGNTYTAGTGLTLTGTQFSVTPNTYSAVNHTHDYTAITNTPSLATVATSGSYNDLTDQPAAYSLPAATSSVLGGVKPDGTTITVTSDGVISSAGGGSGTTYAAGTGLNLTGNTFSLNEATDTTLGGVIVDNDTITVDNSKLTANYNNGIAWTTAPQVMTIQGIKNQVAYDSDYFYVCTDANTWRRIAITAKSYGHYYSNTMKRLSWTTAPASATSTGAVGQVAYDNNYFYICTATNTWERAAWSE